MSNIIYEYFLQFNLALRQPTRIFAFLQQVVNYVGHQDREYNILTTREYNILTTREYNILET